MHGWQGWSLVPVIIFEWLLGEWVDRVVATLNKRRVSRWLTGPEPLPLRLASGSPEGHVGVAELADALA